MALNAPLRRWFAFRLRTLLVLVAVVAVAAAWWHSQGAWVREREEFLRYKSTDFNYGYFPPDVDYRLIPEVRSRWLIRHFGGTIVIAAAVPVATTDGEINHMRRLFPEAVIARGEVKIPGDPITTIYSFEQRQKPYPKVVPPPW